MPNARAQRPVSEQHDDAARCNVKFGALNTHSDDACTLAVTWRTERYTVTHELTSYGSMSAAGRKRVHTCGILADCGHLWLPDHTTLVR